MRNKKIEDNSYEIIDEKTNGDMRYFDYYNVYEYTSFGVTSPIPKTMEKYPKYGIKEVIKHKLNSKRNKR